ncbi:hypothetical protein N7532_004450 [Penicillium argentinense]|uniref:Uncharacterized protein n=1 Tax=Penicillium argentinense TaxID=1131581 RepID=A0A9W9KFI9_9EURO|nr:uncharacterized protein N7532_004450 [Penicillium argentinense]KAJ5103921.1 hypothetical protein N7532_004450 [Penicillium argentinense]
MGNIDISDDTLAKVAGNVVLITGGSSGIGRATAQLCLDLGAAVVIGDLTPPNPELTVRDAEKLKFIEVNVTEWTSIRSMFEQANKWFGRIDSVFACAGVSPTTDFLDITLDESGQLAPPNLRTMDINLLGPIYTTRLAAAYMSELASQRPQGSGGSIVLAASASSFQNFSAGDYTVTKHGVLGMIRGMGSKLEAKGIRLNAIAPSWTATGIVPAELIQSLGATVQSPEAVARSVVLLFADPARNSEVIYSWEGKFREVNKGEGGLLASANAILDNADNEERVMLKLREAQH